MKYAFLLLALTFGCVEAPTASSIVRPHAEQTEPWGGLKVETRGAPLVDSTQVVVLLHGYGAAGADLVSFADHLAADGRAFVFPAAPIQLDTGGLAWVTLESEIDTTLRSLRSLIGYIHEKYPDSEISVGGFSQGASMSSMLVGSNTPIRHAILFSPGLFLDDVARTSGKRTTVYISHGTQDDVLPFSDAEKLKHKLMDAGYDVEFSPFDGGHTIPAEALEEAKAQLDNAE